MPGEDLEVMGFTLPVNCKTEASRLAYCLRYQRVMEDRCIAETITEPERAAFIDEMIPHLVVALHEAQNGNYPQGVPPWVADKLDWNGAELAVPPGLNVANKGAVLSHAKRVFILNRGSAAADDLADKVHDAKKACMDDTYWDGGI